MDSGFLEAGSRYNEYQARVDIFKQDIRKHKDPGYVRALANAKSIRDGAKKIYDEARRKIMEFYKGKDCSKRIKCCCGR